MTFSDFTFLGDINKPPDLQKKEQNSGLLLLLL